MNLCANLTDSFISCSKDRSIGRKANDRFRSIGREANDSRENEGHWPYGQCYADGQCYPRIGILLIGLMLALLATPLSAQDALPVQESVFTAAVTTESSGSAWAYILWQSNAPNLMETRTYSVWRKDGLADAPGTYQRVAVLGLQVDPLAISALLDRAVLALEEDAATLENTIDNLFEDLAVGSINLPDKMSSVILGALAEERYVENLLLAARRHPALNMALGQAAALPIPAAGPVTFEVREHDPVADRDLAVVGRVTVDHAAPVLLPAPTEVALTPPNPRDGYNNMNVKLFWDTPPELRRLMLMTQGFNIYRVEKSFAEAQTPDWGLYAPGITQLIEFAGQPGSGVSKVNDAPVTPTQMLLASEFGSVDHTVAFFVDEETRFPGYPATHTPPVNGDQFYYFVSVRDILGRDINSGTSPGVLGTFCDTMPPPIPSGLRVTNEYVWDGGADNQFLRLHWRVNDNSGDKKTTGYFIYRWQRSDDVYRDGGDPYAQMVAGPLWPTPGQTVMSWDDPGPYNATTGLTPDNTVWYTIRASDDGSLSGGGAVLCFDPPLGNLSGHTPPVPGVLRDRVGPEAPAVELLTWCLRPLISDDRAYLEESPIADPDIIQHRLVATRMPNTRYVDAVEFRQLLQDGTYQFIGRVNLNRGENTAKLAYTDLRGAAAKSFTFEARAVTRFGDKTGWLPISSQFFPGVNQVTVFNWFVSESYDRVFSGSGGGADGGIKDRICRTHFVPPSGSLPPGEFSGLVIRFIPPPDMRQYKVYYRVDNGPLTLAEEGSGEFDPSDWLEVPVRLLPAVASNICIFVQVFDRNGNPSRMQRVRCLPMQGTEPIATPMLQPIRSGVNAADEPTAIISWVAPPHGIDRFRIWIANSPEPVLASGSALLYNDVTTAVPNIVSEPQGGVTVDFDYRSFNSELIGPLFGSGSQFQLEVPVAFGSQMRVKVAAISSAGEVGPWSNIEDFTWHPDPGFTGPDVPWPARPMPGLGASASFSPLLQVRYLTGVQTVGLRIGQAEGWCEQVFENKEEVFFDIYRPEKLTTWLFKRTYGSPAKERTVLPAILYRSQLPDTSAGVNARYPTVPGDVVQVSPLMEEIIVQSVSGGQRILDPFIHVEISDRDQRFCDIYLLDTQPQVAGAFYTYLLALFDPESKEMLQIIPVGSVVIP